MWRQIVLTRKKKSMATKRVSENKVAMTNAAGTAPARRKAGSPKRAAHSATVENCSAPAIENSITPEVASAESVIEITSDAVAKLAYTYWIARGCQDGSPEDDWFRAE